MSSKVYYYNDQERSAVGRDDDDARLSKYFLRRAIELLEQARDETDPVRRIDLELRCLHFWNASKTAQR